MSNVTLKEYFESRLEAIEKATTLANDTLKMRLENVNEFRAALSDQQKTLITRSEVDAKIEGLERNRKDRTALIISLIGVVISILSFLAVNFIK